MTKNVAIIAAEGINLDAVDSAIAHYRATGHRAVRIERGLLVAGLVARGILSANAETVKSARAWAVDGGLNKGTLSTLTGIVFGSARSKREALIDADIVAEFVARITGDDDDSIAAAEELGGMISDLWSAWTDNGKSGKPNRKTAAEKSESVESDDAPLAEVSPLDALAAMDSAEKSEAVLDLIAATALGFKTDAEFQAFADAVAHALRQATIDRQRVKQGKAPQKKTA